MPGYLTASAEVQVEPKRGANQNISDGTVTKVETRKSVADEAGISESQRGMVAARIANYGLGDNQHSGPANLQTHTRAEAAKLLNVSERTVKNPGAVGAAA